MKRKAFARLDNGRIKGQAKHIGKVIKGFACVNGLQGRAKYIGKIIKGFAYVDKPVLPNAWIEDKTNIQSSRYILRSSERYILKDNEGNVLCFVP